MKGVRMRDFSRERPEFALCGLRCCLCPRFNADGPSRCPGCGGEDFVSRHPTCAVETCSKKHGGVAYCFECGDYPCKRYEDIGQVDSFITYRLVHDDLKSAASDLDGFLRELGERKRLLDLLLARYDEGRSKGFYCLASSLLPVDALRSALADADGAPPRDLKEAAKAMKDSLKRKADAIGIGLALRK
jgi:hypothetical protein